MNYRETTLFFLPQGTAKKRERSIKIRFIYYTFSTTVTRSKWSLFFASFVSFFPFVSLFRLLTSASKKQHPLSESRARERALLPSLYIFPNTKKFITKHDDCERRRDIYIHTNTYTRHTKHIAILYDSQ